MSPTSTQQKWTLASVALHDAYTDFILSRQAMQCTQATLEFYKHTAGKFMSWLAEHSITGPQEVTARHVREYLAELTGNGKADNTVHDNARAIKTLLRFWHSENYISAPISFAMPKVAQKRLPVLSADELRKVILACRSPRDKAIIFPYTLSTEQTQPTRRTAQILCLVAADQVIEMLLISMTAGSHFLPVSAKSPISLARDARMPRLLFRWGLVWGPSNPILSMFITKLMFEARQSYG